MRVNFASGEHPFPAPWWNVDLNDHLGVDERVDLLGEWPPSIVDVEVAYIGHWLEHITPAEVRVFLRQVVTTMRPGGRIVVVGPDVDVAEEFHDAGQLSCALLDAIRPHGHRDGADRSHIHEWECTGRRVRSMLQQAGVDRVRSASWDEFAGWGIPVISDAPWQFAVTGTTAVPV